MMHADGRKRDPKQDRKGERLKGAGRLAEKAESFWLDVSRAGLPKLVATFVVAIAVFGLVGWALETEEGGMFSTVFDGIWWAVVTIATVGYGDKYPVTAWGRIAGMLLIFAGVVLTALISGTVASIFVERRIREGKGLQDVRLKGHILVCGWNDNCHGILKGLAASTDTRKSHVALVNAMDAERFEAVRSSIPELDVRFVRGDFTQDATLRKAAAQTARACIIVPDSSGSFTTANADERTILGCLTLKSINPDIVINAEILKKENESHLRRANADGILVNGEFSGFLLASASASAGISDAVRAMLTFDSDSHLRQSAFPGALIGKTFAEASDWFIKNGKGVLVGVIGKDKQVSLDDLLSDDSSAIDAFIKRKFMEADLKLDEGGRQSSSARLNPGASYVIRDTDSAFLLG
jgi:voltage-gated potassium channel